MSESARDSAGRVIVVEDEPVTRALFEGILAHAGFEVSAVDSAAGLRACDVEGADLVLLDIELPDGDGYELARWLRARSEIGIIYVSRRSEPQDRVRGLEYGGDDFIVKPPDADELLARVRAVLRRRHVAPAAPESQVVFAGNTFDPSRFTLEAAGGEVFALTQGEARVLSLLLGARGAVVRREVLVKALGGGEEAARRRSIDVLIHRLRKKLGEGGNVVPQVVLTVQGVGYRIGVDVESTR